MPGLTTASSLASTRPAETATGLAAAVVAVVVATTGLSTELATALVVVVGALPGIVTAIVSATRSTAAGQLLVGMNGDVSALASAALQKAKTEADLDAQTAALKNVTESLASWSSVLSAEPGTKKSAADGT